MFNNLNDDTKDFSANWAMFNTVGRTPDAVQVRRQLRGPRRATSDRGGSISSRSRRRRRTPATCSSTTALGPKRSSRSSNIGTAFRFNEETRPTDAYDGDQTTTSGYGMVDIAMTRAHAADCRRPRRAVRPDRDDAGSVRPVRARSAGDEQEHRCVPGRELRAGRRRQLEHPPQLQHDRQSAGVPRAGRVRVHRRHRQPRGEGQRRPEARADPERRRPVGDVRRRPERHGGQRLLQVLRQADRARRHRRREPDRDVPELRPRQELRHRARSRRTRSASTSS